MGRKDLGKTFLFSKNVDFSKIEGGTGYTYSDGSGYFEGDNGEKIHIYSDGSGYYEDGKGGSGRKYSDGSGYFEDMNGSKGTKYSDGSGYVEDSLGEITNYYSEENNDDTEDEEENESLGELLGQALFVAGELGAQKLKNKIQQVNEEERKRQQRETEKEERKLKIKEKAKKARRKRIKSFLFNKKNLMIGVEYNDLINEKYIVVEKWFKDNGFNNICKKALEDIYMTEEDKQWLVDDITINGAKNFKETDMYPYDSTIVISYHSKRKINIPFSAKQVRKKNCEDIISNLKDVGFTNIHRKEIDDLVTGWINKDGSIQNILINGNHAFLGNQSYNYDAEIVVEYHTFTKKKRFK